MQKNQKIRLRKKRRGILRAVVIILLLLVVGLPAFNLLVYYFSSKNLPAGYKQTAIISHRGGAAYAPENTIAAIDSGLLYHPDYIEIDVRQTKDSQLIIMHDRSVNRTTDGKGKVHDLSLKQLLQMNASTVMKGYPARTTIPLLKQVLERMGSSEAKLIIEIKDPSLYPGIAQRLAAVINELNMASRVLIFSFDTDILFTMKQLLTQVKTGIFTVGIEQLGLADKVDYYCPSFVSLLYYPGLINKIHSKGCKAFVWTVDSSFWIEFLLQHRADGIISNDPKLCAGIYR